MRRFITINLIAILLLASLMVVALLTVGSSVENGTSSSIPATSDAVNSVTVGSAETNTDTTSAAKRIPNTTSTEVPLDGPDMKLYLAPDSTPSVPLYPGAKMTSERCDRSCVSRCVNNYTVSGEEQSTIETFYKEALPKIGWEYVGEQQLMYKFYYYSWENPSEYGPKRIFLGVGFSQESEGTKVAMDLHVWPDPKNPPLHSQATNVKVTWGKDPTPGTNRNVRIVSYTVNLGASELVDYYKSVLIAQGWCADLELSSDLVLSYFFPLIGSEGSSSIKVRIISAEVRSGNSILGTKVEITSSSTEFKPQDAQEGK